MMARLPRFARAYKTLGRRSTCFAAGNDMPVFYLKTLLGANDNMHAGCFASYGLPTIYGTP